MVDKGFTLMRHLPVYRIRRRDVFVLAAALAVVGQTAHPALAAGEWQKVKAFATEVEVPARWKRLDYRQPLDDRNEAQFVENPRDTAAGAWFSIFPTNADLIHPDRAEEDTEIDGKPAKFTDVILGENDPLPRRQIIIYFPDPGMPAFLFDGRVERWDELLPVLHHIVESVRLTNQRQPRRRSLDRSVRDVPSLLRRNVIPFLSGR
jgi:hypothetical protein